MILKHKNLWTIILLVLTTITVMAGSPQGFRGKATYSEDLTIPKDYVVTASVNNIISGSSTIKEEGNYELIIFSENAKRGDTISFFINGEKTEQEALFEPYAMKEIDLYVSSLPLTQTFCGDSQCSIATECSYCSVDCRYSQCGTNGVCEADIGETCANAPTDCGICPTCGDGTCNGVESCTSCTTDCGTCPSGGSGGGSDGGSAESSVVTNVIGATPITFGEETNTQTTNNDIKPLSNINEEEQEEIEEEQKPTFFNKMTGAAIGVFEGTQSTYGWIIVIAIIIIFAWIYHQNKKGTTATPVSNKILQKMKKESSKKN